MLFNLLVNKVSVDEWKTLENDSHASYLL